MASAAPFRTLGSHIPNPNPNLNPSFQHQISCRNGVLKHSKHGGKWPLCFLEPLSSAADSSPPSPALRWKSFEISHCGAPVASPKASPSAGVHSVVVSESSVDENLAEPNSNASKRVLVVGGTGGVGQLVVAALMDRGYKIRAILRDAKKASTIFGEDNMGKIQVFVGDTRNMEKLDASAFEGVTHVICCTGTTAFPSKRWDGDNTPENTDWHGVRNLIDALPRTVQRFVLVSSIGVTKYDQLPWNIMNLFGVLKYKKMGEDYLRDSGIPYTIIRPGRLTDGPYTSYDLNTLLKATAGTRRSVVIGQGDKLVGEASRIIVAEACIQALDIDCTCRNTYEINSIEGDGPGKDKKRWEDIFRKVLKASTN